MSLSLYKYHQTKQKLSLEPTSLFVPCIMLSDITFISNIIRKSSSKCVISAQLSSWSFSGQLAVICSFKYQLMSQLFSQATFHSEMSNVYPKIFFNKINFYYFPSHIYLNSVSGHHRFSENEEQLHIYVQKRTI